MGLRLFNFTKLPFFSGEIAGMAGNESHCSGAHGVGSGQSCSAVSFGWVSSCPPTFVLLSSLKTYLVLVSVRASLWKSCQGGLLEQEMTLGSILYSLGLKIQGLVAVSVYCGQRCLIVVPFHH